MIGRELLYQRENAAAYIAVSCNIPEIENMERTPTGTSNQTKSKDSLVVRLFGPKRATRHQGAKKKAKKYAILKTVEHDEDQQQNVRWFFEKYADVRRAIDADIAKTKRSLERVRKEYDVYQNLAYSQKRFLEFQETIARLEADTRFPIEVFKTMCVDMTDMIDFGGEYGALHLLRSAGTIRVHQELMTTYLVRWKTVLYRRAVLQYLVQNDLEEKWHDLLLGVTPVRFWLSRRLGDVVRESKKVDEDIADFIVALLFPKFAFDKAKDHTYNKEPHLCRVSKIPRFVGHGTPESASEGLAMHHH